MRVILTLIILILSTFAQTKNVKAKVFLNTTKSLDTFQVLVELEIAKDFYIYANPTGNEFSFPTEISLDEKIQNDLILTKSIDQIPLVYQKDSVYKYINKVYFLREYKLKNPQQTKLDLNLKIDGLSCSDGTCVPFDATLSKSIDIANYVSNEETKTLFKNFLTNNSLYQIPKEVLQNISFEHTKDHLKISVSKKLNLDITKSFFIGKDDNSSQIAKTDSWKENKTKFIYTKKLNNPLDEKSFKAILQLHIAGKTNNYELTYPVLTQKKPTETKPTETKPTDKNLPDKDTHLVDTDPIIIGDENSIKPYEETTTTSLEEQKETNPPAIINNTKQEQKQEKQSLFKIIITAFIGGFILNFMPCVFPVISLKIMSFVKQSQEGKSTALHHALLFTLGVLISFWTLALLIIFAQEIFGEDKGWAFQLQNPYFVAIFLAILLSLSLNLFGVYEIGTSLSAKGQNVKKTGLKGSFFSGIFATLVATPCAAPFMGAAVASALQGSKFQALVIFSFMALGVSLPYLFFAIFPKLLKFIPKPGDWMITFKQSMGFIMLLAFIFFAQTYVELVGIDKFISFLYSLAILSIALWIYGKYFTIMSSNKVKYTSLFISIAMVLLAIFITIGQIQKNQESSETSDITQLNIPKENILFQAKSSWITYDEDKIKELKKELYTIKYKKKSDQEILWRNYSPELIEQLKQQNKKFIIDVTAAWCANCQVIKKVVFQPNAEFFNNHDIIMIKADYTKKSPIIKKHLLDEYNTAAIPLILYFDEHNPNGYKFPELPTFDNFKQKVLENVKK